MPRCHRRSQSGAREAPGDTARPRAPHLPGAAMGLLLRVLLLCGAAGERGQLCPEGTRGLAGPGALQPAATREQ